MSYPNNADSYQLGTYASVNNGVVTKSGIGAQSGKLIADTQYEWWAW